MAYGSPLGVSAPTVSSTPGPDYATDINSYLDALKAVVEAKVTPGGMDINADLSFLSGANSFRAKDLRATSYTSQSSLLTVGSYPRSLFFYGGELYANTTSYQVQITNGAGLNISSSGGITGSGYGSSGVEVNWNSGNLAYNFKSGSGANSYADVVCDDLLLNDGSNNFISIVSPAIAADYTIQLPAAVAAANSLVTASSSGTTTALAFSPTPTITSLTTTSTITSGGLITASAGLTAAVDQDITVSGTGRLRHGSRTLVIPAVAFYCPNGHTGLGGFSAASFGDHLLGGDDIWYAGLQLDVGKTVTQVVFHAYNGASGSARTFTAYRTVIATDVVGTIDTVSDSSSSGLVTYTLSTSFTLDDTRQYWFAFQGRSGDYLKAIVVTYED